MRSVRKRSLFHLFACGLVCGFILPVQTGNAQSQELHFEHFTVADGLPMNTVEVILQDHLGFLWVGTHSGLARYDGHTFTTFKPDPTDSTTTLPDRHIFALLEDHTERLWIGTGWGLAYFDRTTEQFATYRRGPEDADTLYVEWASALYEDTEGMLWVGGNGLFRLELASGRIDRHFNDPDNPAGPNNNLILSIYEDTEGTLWIGTAHGLNRFDRETETFTRFFPNSGASPASGLNRITFIHEDRAGYLWMGNGAWDVPGNGLFRFDRQTGAFTHFKHDPEDPGSLSDDRVTSVYEDDDGILWFGTRHSLDRMDPETSTFDHWTHDPDDPTSLSSTWVVSSIYEDRGGTLWIGTYGGGLNKLDRSHHKFPHYRQGPTESTSLSHSDVMTFYEDEDGVLWIGTYGGGLNRLDRATGAFSHYRHRPDDPTTLSSDCIAKMTGDGHRTLWIGTCEGDIDRFDVKTGRVTHYRHDPDDPNTLRSDRRVSGVVLDDDGILWVAKWTGLDRLDPATGMVTHFQRIPYDPDIFYSASGDQVFVLYEAPSEPGVLWIGSNGYGLSAFDTKTARFTSYDDKYMSSIRAIFEDRFGRLWIGTLAAGLHLFDRTTGTGRPVYTSKQGLPNDDVFSIVDEDGGGLWLSTSRGLSWFDPDTKNARHYDERDGILVMPFNLGAAYRDSDGSIYIGGENGMHVFQPNGIWRNSHPPQVALTSMKLFNEPVAIGPDSPLRSHLSETKTITLRHNQNDLSLAYVGLHFSNPARNEYAYRLDPYHDDWQMVGLQRTATFTNLDPGAYTFHVKAANSDGVWNEEGARLSITILPPWWRTWWAYTLYGLLVIAAAAQAYRWQHHRIVRREREAARERELEQAREIERAYHELEETHASLKSTQAQLIQSEKLASLGQLTSGIAHELKNPLNFVNNFAEVNEELARELRETLTRGPDGVEDVLNDLESNARQIARHGKRADRIVQSMMDHARGGTGERYEVTLNAFVDEYVTLSYRSLQARVPDLDVSIERDYADDAGAVAMVPQELGRALLNVLTNAFEAVQEQLDPQVTVRTRRSEGSVAITVSDNGPGIPEAIRAKVFEPFFTTKPTGSGTGLGLSLAYDIVTQGHGGTLTVASTKPAPAKAGGEGTTFTVTLPADSKT